MNARRTKSGTWEAYVYLGVDAQGKKIRKHITGKTIKEVNALLKEVSEGYTVDNYKAKTLTVADCISRYIERKAPSLSPKTLREYEGYKRTAFPELSALPIKALNNTILQNAIDNALKDGKSPKTISNHWGLLKASVSQADSSFRPIVDLPRIKRKRLEMPSQNAIMELLEQIQGKRMEIPVLLACICGMRRGEIASLDLKNDVDYDRGMISVNKDMVQDVNNEWVIKPPKTDAGNRTIPVPKAVLDKLKEARDDPHYTIPTPNGITKGYVRLRKKYGLPCTFHGLRHYYVSVMTALGVPELYQMERVGHSTNSMLKRYQEYLRETEAEINDTMMDHFDKMLDK